MSHDEMLGKLVDCLGGAWPEPCPLNVKLKKTIQQEGYRIESLDYEVEPGDRVPAMLLIPDGVTAASTAPAVAVWHQHNGQYHLGKSEPAGLAGNPMHHTGAGACAGKGMSSFAPMPSVSRNVKTRSRNSPACATNDLSSCGTWSAGSVWRGKNILDMRRAIDVLAQRPEVDANNIGCYGHSMGSTHAWLVGPHEPRLKAIVGNCCLPTYAAIHDTKILHCFPNFVPGWLKYGDTPEIAALIAPRALHLNLGETDGGSPIDYAREGVRRIEAAYRTAGASEQFSYFIEPDTGHVLSAEMWKRVRAFFARHLRG